MVESRFFNYHYRMPHLRTQFTMRSPLTQTTQSKPRVRSVPILDGDEATLLRNQPAISQPDSAVKIQKAFRRFRVRETVKKILELMREVDAVERKLKEEATMAVIKRDGMERLKVNENLMALLFKLDSVRGFNDEIRACRKAVIRKAIALQEFIDSVIDDATMMEAKEKRESEQVVADDDVKNLDNSGGMDENGENSEEFEEAKAKGFDEETDKLSEEAMADDNAMQVETAATSATYDARECVGEETEDILEGGEEVDNGGNEDREERKAVVKGPPNEEWCVAYGEEEEEEKRKKENLLEKLADDHHKLMEMMPALFDQITVQNHVICSLSLRVKNLEKAMSDRSGKKKKNKINGSLI